MVAWGALVGVAWHWFGWLDGPGNFGDFSLARLSLELLVLVAAGWARHSFSFPFLTLISAVVGWFFVIDLVSGGGTWTKVVTLLVGLVYFVAGVASGSPSAFWLQLASGALIGGVFLDWWHASDTDWALVSAAALVYVLIAYGTKRSSWAVLGTIGFLGATLHYLVGSLSTQLLSGPPSVSGWSPAVAFACLGFWFVALGLLGRRRVP